MTGVAGVVWVVGVVLLNLRDVFAIHWRARSLELERSVMTSGWPRESVERVSRRSYDQGG